MPELMSSILFIVLGDLLLLGIIVYFLVRYFDRRFKNEIIGRHRGELFLLVSKRPYKKFTM